MTENAGKENLPETIDKTKGLSLLGGIAPRDFGELTRFADLVHNSKLAPKSFDTVEKVAVGMLTNMELGRPIITGMQDLAIINGRCGLYGDASYAMVTASGLMEEGYPKSEETGTPYADDWTFTFTVKRKGRPEEAGVWTWADSKKAGFDAPKTKDGRVDRWSPWTRFTKRMMQWKARNFVLRDNFGDVLKGMKTVEDLHDLDAVPLTKDAGGTYSTDASTADDLSAAIKKKTAEQNDVEKKKEKPTTLKLSTPCPYCTANIKTVIVHMLESGANTFVCPACKKEGKIEDGEPVVLPPVDPEKQEKVEQKTTPETWGDWRKEWINKKEAGFSTYFHKNKEAFDIAPTKLQEEARVKWLKLYPETPWPLAPAVEESEELSPEGEELKATNIEINKYPKPRVLEAMENVELPPNRVLSLDESNILLAECKRLTDGGGDLA